MTCSSQTKQKEAENIFLQARIRRHTAADSHLFKRQSKLVGESLNSLVVTMFHKVKLQILTHCQGQVMHCVLVFTVPQKF